MNAYNEIFEKHIRCKIDDTERCEEILKRKDCEVTSHKSKRRKNLIIFDVVPNITSQEVSDWVNNVKFAFVRYSGNNYEDAIIDSIEDDSIKPVEAVLRSNRTKDDETTFLNALKSINYDNGYGTQELEGVIVFNDDTWLSRWEYDGSEGWCKNIIPEEKDYFED